MNRQRRQEAIARRRALIDSHIQMLSSTTRVLPNIIRNRTGRAPVTKYTPPVEYVEKPVPVPLPTQQGQGTSDDPLSNFIFKLDNSSSTGDIYLECMHENDDEGNKREIEDTGKVQESEDMTGGISVEFTEELRKMLADQGNGFMQSFQTVKTEDGTVMVVLEGNNFTENDGTQENTIHFSSGEMPTGVFYQELTDENDGSPVKEERNEEVVETEEAEEDSYMIVHTADGDVLVPSKLCSQVETEAPPPQPSVSAGESIIQFIANESGAIEQLMSSSSKSKTFSNKRTLSVQTVSRSTQNVAKKPKPASKVSAHVTATNKFRITSSTSFSLAKAHHQKTMPLSKKESIPAAKPKLKPVYEEKPKPFRFDLPEMEDFDSFMPCSVPVPIMIDSLRSESRPSKSAKVVNPKVVSNLTGSSKEKSVTMYTNGSEKGSTLKATVPEKVPAKGISLESARKTQQKVIVQVTSEHSSETLDSSQNSDSFNSLIQCGKCMELFSNESLFVSHLKSCVDSQNSQEIQHSSLIDITSCLEKGENIFLKSVTETTSSASSPIVCASSSSDKIHLISSPGHEQLSSNGRNQNVVHFTSDNQETTSVFAASEALCDEFVTYTSANQEQNGISQNQIENNPCKSQESGDIGRRTLNKATAKANMSNELVEETEVWDGDSSYSGDKTAEDVDKHTDGNGNTITIQSARIRSRNDRIKALDENATNEEEMLTNFRNIYEQVVKQSVAFN